MTKRRRRDGEHKDVGPGAGGPSEPRVQGAWDTPAVVVHLPDGSTVPPGWKPTPNTTPGGTSRPARPSRTGNTPARRSARPSDARADDPPARAGGGRSDGRADDAAARGAGVGDAGRAGESPAGAGGGRSDGRADDAVARGAGGGAGRAGESPAGAGGGRSDGRADDAAARGAGGGADVERDAGQISGAGAGAAERAGTSEGAGRTRPRPRVRPRRIPGATGAVLVTPTLRRDAADGRIERRQRRLAAPSASVTALPPRPSESGGDEGEQAGSPTLRPVGSARGHVSGRGARRPTPARPGEPRRQRVLEAVAAINRSLNLERLLPADEEARQRRLARLRRVGMRVGSITLAGMLVYAVFPVRTYLNQRAATERAREQIEVLSRENDRLEQRAEDLRDPETVEEIARRELGLVMPGEESYGIFPAPEPESEPESEARTTTTTVPPG